MTQRMTGILLIALTVMGCGRETSTADLKMVGVGMDPDQIGPVPTAYGGLVEYNHVSLAGAGLPLALMGLGNYNEVGPSLMAFEPPYSAVIGFSYLFDEKLPAADSLTFVIPVPPSAEDSCYTQYDPVGPLGSFSTVDVGDYMELRTRADNELVVQMERVPKDYPPDPQDLFIYYSQVESYAPENRTRLEPSTEEPDNPLAMNEVTYRHRNFPFGEEVTFGFPGGFSFFDQPVSSIPRPSASMEDNVLVLPEEVGSVLMSWSGPKYMFDATQREWQTTEGHQSSCFEFVDNRNEVPETIEACDTPSPLPQGEYEYDRFKGQMYTGPWETETGVDFQWDPGESADDIILSVRFLAELDTLDSNLTYPAVELSDGSFRPAQQCEEGEESTSFVFDEDRYVDNGQLTMSLQGDPFSRMAEVTCRIKNDGDFTLTSSFFS